jgi:hypothetical protein
MLPLTLLAGGASDYARAREVRSALQDRLDAAVLGGVKGSDPVAAAGAAFEAPTSAGVTFAAPSFVLTPAGLLEGDASASVPAAFLGLAGIETFTVRAQASAGLKRMPTDVCLTAVNTTGPGLTRQGSGDIHATNCRFEIRSTATPAASFGGNGGSVTASDVCVRGATVFGNAPSTLRTSCTIENAARLQPPAPPVGSCTNAADLTIQSNTPYELPPGTYCGNVRLEGSGAFTLRPNGVYVLRARPGGTPGQVTYAGGGSLRGSALIYFADSTRLELGDSGQVVLSGPTSGPYQGVLMSENLAITTATSMSFKRSSGAFLKGVIHLPSRHITVGGSGSAVMDEVTMVVRSISTDGAGTYSFKPAPLSVAHVGEAVLKQ